MGDVADPARYDEDHEDNVEDEKEVEQMREEEEEEEHGDDVEMEEEEEEEVEQPFKEIVVDVPAENVFAEGDLAKDKALSGPSQDAIGEQQPSISLGEISQRPVEADDASSAPSDSDPPRPEEEIDGVSSSNHDASALLALDVPTDTGMDLTVPHSRDATPTHDALNSKPEEDDLLSSSTLGQIREEGMVGGASGNDDDIDMEASSILSEAGAQASDSAQEQPEHHQETTLSADTLSSSPSQAEPPPTLRDPSPSSQQSAPSPAAEPVFIPEPPAPKKLSLQDFINRKRQKQKEESKAATAAQSENAEQIVEPSASVAETEAEAVEKSRADVVEVPRAAELPVQASSVQEVVQAPTVSPPVEETPVNPEMVKAADVPNSELAKVFVPTKAGGDQPQRLDEGKGDVVGVTATVALPVQESPSIPMDVSGPSEESKISPAVNNRHVVRKPTAPTRTPRPGTRFSPQKPSTYVPNPAWLTKIELADDPPLPPARSSSPASSSNPDVLTHKPDHSNPRSASKRQAPPHTQSNVRPPSDSNATLAPSLSVLQRSNSVASAEDGEIVSSGPGSGARTPTPTLKPTVPLYNHQGGSGTASGGIGKPRMHTPPTQPRSFGATNNSNTSPNTVSPGGLPRRPSVHGGPSPNGPSRSWSPVQGRAPPSGPRALRNGSASSHPYYGAGRGGAPSANTPFAPRGERERSGWNGTPTGPRGGGAGRGR